MAVGRSYLLTTPVTGLDLGNLGTGDGVSEFGGIVLVIKGKSGDTIVSQTAANSLPDGRFFSAVNNEIGSQANIPTEKLGGGITSIEMRWTIYDVDINGGIPEYGGIGLGINGVELADQAVFNDTGLQTYIHNLSGQQASSMSGFPDSYWNTVWVKWDEEDDRQWTQSSSSNESKLESIYADLESTHTAKFNYFDYSSSDNYVSFQDEYGSSSFASWILNYNLEPLVIPAPNKPPTLTIINSFNGEENTYKEITYEDLLSASNAEDQDEDTISFIIEDIQTGSLQKKTGNEWIEISESESTLSTGETIRWRGNTNAHGSIDAFTIRASDGIATSATPINVHFEVEEANNAPTLSTISPFQVDERTWTEITYERLLNASNAEDQDGDSIEFRIDKVYQYGGFYRDTMAVNGM